jgi:hypothetical protein
MTNIDGGPAGDAEHMPARWYSVQWVSVRIVWALFAAGLIVRGDAEDTPIVIGAVIVGVLVFVGLTLVAHHERRRWARDHS